MPECAMERHILGAHTYQEALAFDKKAIKPQEATNFMVVGPKLVLSYIYRGVALEIREKIKSICSQINQFWVLIHIKRLSLSIKKR